MEQLRGVLKGTWAGSYGYEGRRQSHRTNTQLTIIPNISPSTGTLGITGGGQDQYGRFEFKGSATSENEISCVKEIRGGGNWWHKAKVDLDKKEMHGQWGPANKPNQTDGSFVFQRQMTEEERQQEAAAAARRKQEQEEAARKKQEQEEAARRKQEQEEAAKKQQEQEEAARKQQEQEEAARKQQEQEAARKKQEQEEAARKKQEQEEATRRKQEQEKEETARTPTEEGEAENPLVQLPDTDQKDKEAPRPQETAQTTVEKGKPVVLITDSEDDIAGNLKIHLKLDLDADIRVIAALKGDIVLGIL